MRRQFAVRAVAGRGRRGRCWAVGGRRGSACWSRSPAVAAVEVAEVAVVGAVVVVEVAPAGAVVAVVVVVAAASTAPVLALAPVVTAASLARDPLRLGGGRRCGGVGRRGRRPGVADLDDLVFLDRRVHVHAVHVPGVAGHVHLGGAAVVAGGRRDHHGDRGRRDGDDAADSPRAGGGVLHRCASIGVGAVTVWRGPGELSPGSEVRGSGLAVERLLDGAGAGERTAWGARRKRGSGPRGSCGRAVVRGRAGRAVELSVGGRLAADGVSSAVADPGSRDAATGGRYVGDPVRRCAG